MSLTKRVFVEFCNIDDVYNELILLYDEAIEKGFDLGEALYKQAAFFTDYQKLVDVEIQDLIKKYRFCKKFNCPPYPSLKDTPEKMIDDFIIIDEEHHKCIQKMKENNKDN